MQKKANIIDIVSWQSIHEILLSDHYSRIHHFKEYDVWKMWASNCVTQFLGGDPGDECGRMTRFMEQSTAALDWTSTFQKPLVLIFEDMLPHQSLVCIHHWLRSKSLDIENIIFLNNHQTGMAEWYERWKTLHHEPGFKILEWPFTQSTLCINYMHLPDFCLPDGDWIKISRSGSIKKLFSFYGGRHHGFMDKFYAMLRCLEFNDSAVVDYASTWLSPEITEQYLEHVTDYKDQSTVERLMHVYHNHRTSTNEFYNPRLDPYLKAHQKPKDLHKHEYTMSTITYQDLQWQIDKECFLSVIRETLLDQPYGIITEKTYRAFLHYTFPVPLTYRSAECLESLGYRLPHDIIDYNYTNEPRFQTRIEDAIRQVEKIQKNMNYDDMNEYWDNNWSMLHHNALNTKFLFDNAYSVFHTGKLS